MANYQFKTRETTKAKLDLIPISIGQMITCSDTGELYFDTAYDGRKSISDFIILDTDSERIALISPVTEKLYLIKETNFIWRYDGTSWIQLTYPKVEIIRGVIANITEEDRIDFDVNFIINFNPNTDTLFIYQNSVLLLEGIDYDGICADCTGPICTYYIYDSDSRFKGTEEAPTIIQYIIYKNTGSTPIVGPI